MRYVVHSALIHLSHLDTNKNNRWFPMSLNEFWCTKESFKPYSFDRLMQMTESIPGSSEEDDM